MPAYYQTLNNVFEDVRYNAGKDSTTLTDADLLRIANKYYLLVFRELADLNEHFYAQISHTDLVSGQREYPLPVDNTSGAGSTPFGGGATNIMRVELTYDGTNWEVARPTSFTEMGGPSVTDADLANMYQKEEPYFWFFDRSLFIAPVPDASDAVTAGNNGLYIWYVQRPKELQNLTDIPDLPKDYLNVLAEGILMDVYRKYGRLSDFQKAEQRFLQWIERSRADESGVDFDRGITLKAKPKLYS